MDFSGTGMAGAGLTGLSNLLQNKLFLQYLAGAGGAIGAGQSIAPVLSQITQQNIGAQSQAALTERYMGMLGKMLSGEEVPEGGKVVHSEKGTKVEFPKMQGTPDLPTAPGSAQLGTINPFLPSQPGISAADLAGLGPQDISRALSGATGVEALKQQTIANLLRTRPVPPSPLEGKFPIPHPEVGTMTLRQWSSLPAEEKEFAAYIQTARRLGAPKEELTRRFFSSLEPTEREKFVRSAMEDPKLMAATKELSEAARTQISIGEKVAGKVAEKKALGRLKGQLYFSDPKWIDDIGKHLSDVDVQREIFVESQREGGDPELMKTKKTIKYIEDKISAGKGTIRDIKFSDDDRTMIWTVKWPSGDMEDIRYAVRP